VQQTGRTHGRGFPALFGLPRFGEGIVLMSGQRPARSFAAVELDFGCRGAVFGFAAAGRGTSISDRNTDGACVAAWISA